MLKKIVSGGQTGVDRSALDVAIELNYAYGGWCPRGRKAEDGMIDPIRYANLQETSTDRYPQRTKMNVQDSDGTLIISHGNEDEMSAGTKLTFEATKQHRKPVFLVNLKDKQVDVLEIQAMEWIKLNNIETLNVAGPREQTIPGIYEQARTFLRSLLQKMKA